MSTTAPSVAGLPPSGMAEAEILAAIKAMQADDVDWRRGRALAGVFFADDELLEVIHNAYMTSFSENALIRRWFRSLQMMEEEVVATLAGLMRAPASFGDLTSSGTESIFLALQAARDQARALNPRLGTPQIVVARNGHPCVAKVAHYLGVEEVRVDVDHGHRADPSAMERAITDDTILLIGSAPSFPIGVIDPIDELGRLAQERGIPLHVDACVGGMLLPFARRLGRPVPPFDFEVEGVTSISLDLHKFGYTAKGCSAILHRSDDTHRYQTFLFDDWPGGGYSTRTFLGTRPGGPVAAAWAALKYLGEEGYLRLAERSLTAADELAAGIARIPELEILGEPTASLLAFSSSSLDVGAIAGALAARGWGVVLQKGPPENLHLNVTAAQAEIVDEFLADLEAAVAGVASGTPMEKVEAWYS